MHWQYWESSVNMIDGCSWLVRWVTTVKCFTTFLDEKKHAFQSTFLGGWSMSDQWKQKVK